MEDVLQPFKASRAIREEQILRLLGPISPHEIDETGLVRFGWGEFDSAELLLPGVPLSRIMALRGFVRALRIEAEIAFEDAVSLSRAHFVDMSARIDTLALRLDERLPARIAMASAMTDSPDRQLRAWGRKQLRAATQLIKTTKEYQEYLQLRGDSVGEWASRWNLRDPQADDFVEMVFWEANTRACSQITGQQETDHDIAWRRREAMMAISADEVEVEEVDPLANLWTISLPTWQCLTEDEKTYVALARRVCEEAIAKHVHAQRVNLAAAERNLVPTKVRPRAHFGWYTRYQVLRESLATIAERSYATDGAVWAALRSVTELSGMPLRDPGKGGRPKNEPPKAEMV